MSPRDRVERTTSSRPAGHAAPLTQVVATHDAVYTAAYDGRVMKFARDGRTILWSSTPGPLLNALAIDGETVATGGADRMLTVRRAVDGEIVRVIGRGAIDDDVNAAVLVDGLALAVGEDGILRAFDLHTGVLRWQVAIANGERCLNTATTMRMSGKVAIAIGDDAGELTFISVAGAHIASQQMEGAVESVARAGPDRLLVALDTGSVLVFDATTFKARELHRHDSAAKAVAAARDGSTCISVGYDGIGVTAEVASGRSIRFELSGCGRHGWARHAAFDPVDQRRAFVTSLSPTPQIWDLTAPTLAVPDAVPTSGVNCVVSAADCAYAGGDDGLLRVVRPDEVRTVASLGEMITALAVAADGSLLVGTFGGAVAHYDVRKSRLIDVVRLRNEPVNAITPGERGEVIVAFYSGIIMVVAAHGQRVELPSPGAAIKSLARTSKDEVVAGTADGRLLAISLDDHLVRWERDGLELVNAVAWSDANQILASVGRDLVLRLWSREGVLLASAAGHTCSTKALAWSRDGHWLATAGYDAAITTWSAGRRLEERRVLRGHELPGVPAVAFLGTDTLVSGGWDQTIRIWNTRSGKLLRIHDLTSQENS